MVSVFLFLAVAVVAADICDNTTVRADLKERGTAADPVSGMGDVRRISESRHMVAELKIL